MSALLTRQTKVAIREENVGVLANPELLAKAQAEGDAQDDSWQKASKSIGVKIWRIEQFKLVDWPERGPHVFRDFERYGYFYDEDAYIVLHTYSKGDSDQAGPPSYDLYYWIGQKATLHDVAAAAFRSVEIDDFLGKRAVHYRESQGHESERFLRLFPNFMVYRGGRTTKWHHPSQRLDPGVKKIYRMWTTRKQVYAEFYHDDPLRKQIISYELPLDAALEIEQGGVYVYDSADKLALFSTRASHAWDRFWVGEMAMHIGYSRLGFYNNLAQFDEGTPGDKVFMGLIGVDKVTPLHSRVYEHTESPRAELYRVGETVPQLTYSTVESPVALDGLDSSAIYLLDGYANAHYPVVYVWVGKDVDESKARIALVNGEVYLKEKRDKQGPEIALSVGVIRIRQGLETPEFLKSLGIKSEPEPKPEPEPEPEPE